MRRFVDPEGVTETERLMQGWTEVMAKDLRVGWKEQVGKKRAERRARPKKKRKA